MNGLILIVLFVSYLTQFLGKVKEIQNKPSNFRAFDVIRTSKRIFEQS